MNPNGYGREKGEVKEWARGKGFDKVQCLLLRWKSTKDVVFKF